MTKTRITYLFIGFIVGAVLVSRAFPDFGQRLGNLLIVFVIFMGPALFAEEAFDLVDRLNARVVGKGGQRWGLHVHILIAIIIAGGLAIVWPEIAQSLLKDEASLARQWLEYATPVEQWDFRLLAIVMALFGYLFEPLYFWLLERR